jgi:hypothetical protein
VAGAAIAWEAVFPPAARRRVPLPLTPFELIPCGVRLVAPAVSVAPAAPVERASDPLVWAAEWVPVAPALGGALTGSWLVAGDPALVAALRVGEAGAEVRECAAAE